MTTVQKRCARAGFSLMEIMIAITILGLIMAMVGPALQNTLRKAKVRTAKASLKSLQNFIDEYKTDIGTFPQKLKDLIDGPRDEKGKKHWEGSILKTKEVPEDPWRNDFVYKLTPGGAKNPYELYSYGANGPDALKEEWISVWDE